MEAPEISLTPPELKEIASKARERLVPTKSKPIYDQTLAKFKTWCAQHKVPENYFSEGTILAYAKTLAETMRPSTVWSKISMLRKTILAYHSLDLGEMATVKAFTHRHEMDHPEKKKSAVFTRENVERYLSNASDDAFLATKVALLFGLFGGLRRSELAAITLNDISAYPDHLLIVIPASKTGRRSFVVPSHPNPTYDPIRYYEKYLAVRPSSPPTVPDRLFLRYHNGRCSRQVIGKNKFSELPREVATFLALPNAKEFTGHALRRSSATWLADSGASLVDMKRFAGWKSDSVAQGYIAESVGNKRKLAGMLQNDVAIEVEEQGPAKKAQTGSGMAPMFQFNNCNVTIQMKDA